MAFKIDKVNKIPEKCLDNDTHLYIKEDGTLYVNKKDGSIISIGGKEIDLSGYIKKEEFHTHTNLDNLNKIGEDSEGNLTYNGNLVNKDMDITNIENNINEQHSKIESIENTVSEYDSRIQQVETNVSEYDSRIQQVETNVSEYDSRIQQVETNVSEYDSRIQQVETNVSGYDSRIQQVETNVSGYDSKIESVENTVSEYDSRIEELENKFNTEIGETHNHTNLDNLNKIGEDSEGNLTYNGNLVNKDMDITNIENNINEQHSRIESIENELKQIHTHTNLDNLNKIGEDSEGNLTYNGEPTLTNKDFEVFKTNTIGTSELSTDDKTLKGAINELFTSVSNGKNLLETAITDKGGVVSKSGDIATFDELKSGILDVPTSNCKLNIFTQSTEPITKQGLWLKTDNTYDKIEDFNNTKFDSFKYTVTNHGYDGGYAKSGTKCVKVGKYAYLIGGDRVTSKNLRYDLETNQTATMTSIPGDYIYSPAPNFCCSDNINKIFLIQCGTNEYKSAQYNIDTNTYTALGFSEDVFTNRGDSCYYKNKIYCFSTSSRYNYIYNLDTTTKTNIPTSIDINLPKIVLIDDNVYLISDYNSSGNCYKYNITTGTVTTLTTSPLKARTDVLTVCNYGNYIYQCSQSSAIGGESTTKLAIVRYDILNNKHERIMETVGTSDTGYHYCGVIYNNKLLLFYSSRTYYIDFILNKNCLYLDKSDNTNTVLLVETPYELLNKKETFKSCFLTNNNSESISCDIYTGNGTSWNKI